MYYPDIIPIPMIIPVIILGSALKDHVLLAYQAHSNPRYPIYFYSF